MEIKIIITHKKGTDKEWVHIINEVEYKRWADVTNPIADFINQVLKKINETIKM